MTDYWSQEAYKSSYRLAHCHDMEEFPDRFLASNAARMAKSGKPGERPADLGGERSGGGSPGSPGVGDGRDGLDGQAGLPYGARLLVKESTYRNDFRHGQAPEKDPHLESFRHVALPNGTWNTEHWLSNISRRLGGEETTSPRLPIKSVYQDHFEKAES